MATPSFQILFKNVEELLVYLPIGDLIFSMISPDIRAAEDEYLKPILGADLLDQLRDAYNTATDPYAAPDAGGMGDGMFLPLLLLCQKAVAHLAIDRYVIYGQIDVSSSGVGNFNNGKKASWQWQIDDVRSGYLLDKGYKALDEVLAQLEVNMDSYPNWKYGAGLADNLKFFINKTEDFNSYVNISSSRLTFKALWPIMKKVEDFIIAGSIGDQMVFDLKASIHANSITGNDQAVLNFLLPAIAHLTAARALVEIPVVIQDDAIVMKAYRAINENSREILPASDTRIAAKIRQLDQDGQAYLMKAVKYLNDYASSSTYASYYNSSLYKGPNTRPSTFTNTKGNTFFAALTRK